MFYDDKHEDIPRDAHTEKSKKSRSQRRRQLHKRLKFLIDSSSQSNTESKERSEHPHLQNDTKEHLNMMFYDDKHEDIPQDAHIEKLNKNQRKRQKRTVLVMDRRYPEVTLSQEQADLIRFRLDEEIFDASEESNEKLQYVSTGFTSGKLSVHCLNIFTKNWILNTVRSMSHLWEDAQVIAVESNRFPRRSTVSVCIPGAKMEEDLFRTRLEKQNDNLETGGWIFKNRDVTYKDLTLTYSIDQSSYEWLEANAFMAFYGLGRVQFRNSTSVD